MRIRAPSSLIGDLPVMARGEAEQSADHKPRHKIIPLLGACHLCRAETGADRNSRKFNGHSTLVRCGGPSDPHKSFPRLDATLGQVWTRCLGRVVRSLVCWEKCPDSLLVMFISALSASSDKPAFSLDPLAFSCFHLSCPHGRAASAGKRGRQARLGWSGLN